MNRQDNNLNFIDAMSLFSVFLQIVGYENDLKQTSNDDLMREIQKQNAEYLEKIIENTNEILTRLKEG